MVTICVGSTGPAITMMWALIDPGGRKLGRRISDDATGLGELTGMFAEHGGAQQDAGLW